MVFTIIIYKVQILTHQMKGQQKNTFNKRVLESNSDQWKLIDFKVQLTLGISSVAVKKIYDISNTHVQSAFNNQAKGSIVLQSFIETSTFTESNKIQKIIQKGFDLSPKGLMFNIGYNRSLNMKSKKQFTFILSKIAVGKSYCYPLKKFNESPIQCPEGFQSIYLYQQQENPQVFTHQYVIFKNQQIYPIYLIEVVVDIYQQQKKKHPPCENCNKIPPQPAKFYCVTQDANFCYQCNEEYHNTKLGNKHQRVDIAEKPKKFGFCETHDGVNLELYCKTCAQALCVNCKINGDHASGEMAEHSLTKLKQAYNDISSKVKQIDPNIQRRKNQLMEDLSKIDMKINEVNLNATKIQQYLIALYQKAMEQLQYQTKKKLSFLIGDQLQLKRQYDHILWMESFLKHQLQMQDPNQFIKSWYKYSKYKKQILSINNLSINTEVKADIKLQGSIHIVVESSKKRHDSIQPHVKQDQIMMQTTPIKQNKGMASQSERQLGSTSLRKTIFKKFYSDRMLDIGNEPKTLKGSIPDSNAKQSMKKQ